MIVIISSVIDSEIDIFGFMLFGIIIYDIEILIIIHFSVRCQISIIIIDLVCILIDRFIDLDRSVGIYGCNTVRIFHIAEAVSVLAVSVIEGIVYQIMRNIFLFIVISGVKGIIDQVGFFIGAYIYRAAKFPVSFLKSISAFGDLVYTQIGDAVIA